MKDCGSCNGFIKLKNDQYSGGLCLFKDYRTNTDYGKNCSHWKGIKYNRKKKVYGEVGGMVYASGCGPDSCGFESRTSPQ